MIAMKVLVAYASKYGATEGIAQRIGETLTARGLEVDVRRCKDLDEASGYDAYVVGSATYEFNWRKAARKFVTRNADELAAKPTWLFASGPVGAEKVDKDGNDVLKGAEPRQFEQYEERIHPRGKQVFMGAYDHDKIRGADRIFTWMPVIRNVLPEGDYREWDVIEAWASAIAQELQESAARP